MPLPDPAPSPGGIVGAVVVLAAAIALVALPGLEVRAAPQELDELRSVRDGVFSEEQAERGRRTFVKECEECHQLDQFTDPFFIRSWSGDTLDALFDQIRTAMPENSPGKLSPPLYADLVAYLLTLSGFPAGEGEITPDNGLEMIRIEDPAKSESH